MRQTTQLSALTVLIALVVPAKMQASSGQLGTTSPISETELTNVYERAIMSSPLVEAVHKGGLQRRCKESVQLQIILDRISEFEQTPEYEPMVCADALGKLSIPEEVIKSLEADLFAFQALDREIKSCRDHIKRLTQFRTNKLSIIVKDALDLAKTKGALEALLDGNLSSLDGYSIDPPWCNAFPNSSHIYSVGRRGNALKTVFLKIWCVQNKKNVSDVGQFLFNDHKWADTTPLLHVTPVNEDFDLSCLGNSPYLFKDAKTPKGILTVNNGYALGGQRWQKRYSDIGEYGKEYGPQDCSSFVAKYTNSPKPFSTFDQSHLFFDKIGFPSQQISPSLVSLWNESRVSIRTQPDVVGLRERFTPLGTILDPQSKSLVPGLIHAERTYNMNATTLDDVLDGVGGHTGIFLGCAGSGRDTKAVTITNGRNLEISGKEFSHGVEAQDFFSTRQKLIMWFAGKQ
jgi:hypothetical protein